MVVQPQQTDKVLESSVKNGYLAPRGRPHHKPHHHTTKPVSGLSDEFNSQNKSNHTGSDETPQRSDEEEMSQQTQKVMEAFLKSIVSKNGVAERIRRGSRQHFIKCNDWEQNRIQAPSGRGTQSEMKPTTAMSQGDEEKLYKVMNGRMSNPTRHRSGASVASSDSADSSLSKGRFHRTRSFAKAQLHPVVTELESKEQLKNTARRSSEDVPQTLPLRRNSSVRGRPRNNEKQQAGSPISHTRASSDPVIARYDTTGRFKAQQKGKGGWFRRFKKKKGGHKTKDDSKDSTTSGEGVATTNHATKISKSHRALYREDSVTSKRINGSAVAADGFPEHGSKPGRHSAESQRHSTVDASKKKSHWKKFKNFFVDSTSFSPRSSPYSSRENLTKDASDVPDGGAFQEQESKHCQAPDSRQPEPSPGRLRGRYQHRATKSMNDMEPPDRELSEVGMKLMKVLKGYSHIVAKQYAGPAGRTHTPDSYQQHMQKMGNRGKASLSSPLKRSCSQTAAGHVQSHSMKAFYNLSEASRAGAGSGERKQARRITRDDIRPSNSTDYPHRRAEGERRLPRPDGRAYAHHQQRKTSPAPQRAGADAWHSRSSSLPGSSPSRRFSFPSAAPAASHRRGPTAARRHPRPSSVAADAIPKSPNHSALHTYQIEIHSDRTITARSPRQTRKIHRHTDTVQIVESDAPPAVPMFDASPSDDDMTAAFGDDDEVEITDERTERIVIDEIDGGPVGEAGLLARQRSSTEPNLPTIPFDSDELDNDDDSALGAVGGTSPEQDEVDVDKLADRIVRALRRKGDEMTTELEAPPIDEALSRKFSQLSREMIRDIVERALAKINAATVSFRHPDIIRLAVGCWLNSTAGFLNWFIEPIAKSFGGWNATSLISSLDETTREISSLDHAPTTSGLSQHDSSRSSDNSDTSDGELD